MSIADLVWKDRLVEKPNTFKATTNLSDGTITLERAEGVIIEEGTPINAQNMNMITASLSDMVYQTATGTGTVITLTIKGTLVNGYPITFIASANNSGTTTTINGKKLYKPGTTTSPTLISGKAYTVWYNLTGDCFFIKASATGTVLASQVLKNATFSTEVDTDLVGTLDLSLLISSNIKAGITINGITGATNVVDTTLSANIPTAAMILSGYKCYVNGALVTGTATNKVAATISPSTSAQTIAANTLCTGIQTIAATTGTASSVDVVAGKTFNSASGIGQTGTATIASLGGANYATGTINHIFQTKDTVTFPFTPRVIIVTHSSSQYVGYYFISTDKEATKFYRVGSSGADGYLTKTTNTISLDANLATGTTVYYAYL